MIIQEKPSFKNLIFRKSRSARTIEVIMFLAALLLLLSIEGGYTLRFKVGAFIAALLVVIIRPIFYRVIIQPEYTLTEKCLVISKRGNERSYPLNEKKKEYDLPFIYSINGKKQELMISDPFIDALNTQLEVIEQLKKKK